MHLEPWRIGGVRHLCIAVALASVVGSGAWLAALSAYGQYTTAYQLLAYFLTPPGAVLVTGGLVGLAVALVASTLIGLVATALTFAAVDRLLHQEAEA